MNMRRTIVVVCGLLLFSAPVVHGQSPGFTIPIPQFEGTYIADTMATHQVSPVLPPGEYWIQRAYFHAEVDSLVGSARCCYPECSTSPTHASVTVSISGTPKCPNGWIARGPDDDEFATLGPSYLIFRYDGLPTNAHPCNFDFSELVSRTSTISVQVSGQFILACSWLEPAELTFRNVELFLEGARIMDTESATWGVVKARY